MKLKKSKTPAAKKPVAAKKTPDKKPAVKKAVKPAKPATKPVLPAKSKAKTPVPVPAKNQGMAKPAMAAPAPVMAKIPSLKKDAKAAKELSKSSGKKAVESPTVEVSVKRPAKLFFIEVKPGSERVIKRGDKSLATPPPLDIQARRKDTATEETSEELVERIERELQHQSFFKHNALKPQMCTKCGINAVAERFTIDRELGYCLDCADILRLGATKEARRMEFNPVAKKEAEPGVAAADEGGEIEPPAEGDEEPIPDID